MRGAKVDVVCEGCGVAFTTLRIKRRSGKGKYCSLRCFHDTRSARAGDRKQQAVFHQKKHKYGLNRDAYLRLFAIQNNRCAICHMEFDDTRRATVDHCHTSKAVRGLLCNRCNTLLGCSQDSLDILQSAKEYLTRSSS